MSEKILILGGTKEAAELAQHLFDQGKDVTSSLAGRTKEPTVLAGKTRIGGFGGAKGLATYLQEHQFTKFIDATHPFAEQISENARLAAELSNTPLEIRTRKLWEAQEGDNWIEVPNLTTASNTIRSGSKVLLALGSQYLDAFSNREDVHFVVRMIDPPKVPLKFQHHTLLLGKPNVRWQEEVNLLKAHSIDCIVCRNSGGTGAYAKVEAARNLGLPVVMVSRANV